MLDELRVRNIALIEDASVEFSSGLTVFTGETGTGKTALLSALKLLIGERADSSVVRDGAAAALVEGRFVNVEIRHELSPDEVDDGLGENVESEDVEEGFTKDNLPCEEIVVMRRVTSDGRSKCSLNDSMATVGLLSSRIGPLLDLHGQHEHQTLLDPAFHLRYLDRWIGRDASVALAEYRRLRVEQRAAKQTFDDLIKKAASSERDAELARFALLEIDRIAPIEGELEELEARLPALQHAESLALDAATALVALREDGGANEKLSAALTALERNRGVDAPLDALAERLADVLVLSEDLADEIRSYRDRVEFDPQTLAATLDRLGELSALCKRYGPRMEDVLRRREEAEETLTLYESIDERIDLARGKLDEAEGAFVEAAGNLASIRVAACDGFCTMLADSVKDLAMEDSGFDFSVTDLPRQAWTGDGSQRFEILYRPGPKITPRPLAKIASGGELSRVMLALKSSVNMVDGTETLVFDEIDAGIGGATGAAVGRKLKELSKTHQVIVVTHLAQIAVYADCHAVVTKRLVDGAPVTSIETVSGEARVEEVARMLSGDTSVRGIEHARALLAEVV